MLALVPLAVQNAANSLEVYCAAPIAVEDRVRGDVAADDGHPQCVHDEAGAYVCGQLPADHHAGQAALDAGADGFLLKRATPEQLIDGIRTVFAGDALVAPAVTRRLLQTYAGRRPPDRERLQLAAHLTEREAAILRALAEGLSNAEIAANLWLSAETVKTHIKNILAKLGVRDRTQAVVWAYRTGFVDPAGRP